MTQSRIPATHLYQVLDVLCITLKNFFMEYIVDLQCCVNFSCTTNWISYAWVHAKLLQSCLTLCDPMDCSPPGFSVHGIMQARILEWVAMPSSRGSSQPRDWTWVFCIAGEFLTAEPPGKPQSVLYLYLKYLHTV